MYLVSGGTQGHENIQSEKTSADQAGCDCDGCMLGTRGPVVYQPPFEAAILLEFKRKGRIFLPTSFQRYKWLAWELTSIADSVSGIELTTYINHAILKMHKIIFKMSSQNAS